MTQLSLLTGAELKEAGIKQVIENDDSEILSLILDCIEHAFCFKYVVTADDVRAIMQQERIVPHHPNLVGAAFRTACARGLIRRVGTIKSSRPEAPEGLIGYCRLILAGGRVWDATVDEGRVRAEAGRIVEGVER